MYHACVVGPCKGIMLDKGPASSPAFDGGPLPSIIPLRGPSGSSVNTEIPTAENPVKSLYLYSSSQVCDIAYDVFYGAFVNVGPCQLFVSQTLS